MSKFREYEYHPDFNSLLDDIVERLGGSVSAANPDHLVTARQIVDAVADEIGGEEVDGGDDRASFHFIWNRTTVTRTVEEDIVFDILSFTVEVGEVSETVTIGDTDDIRTFVAVALDLTGVLDPNQPR